MSSKFEYFVIIKPNGRSITKVKNSREHLCSEVYSITEGLGEMISDDEIPEGDCDRPDRHVTLNFEDGDAE